VPFNISFRSQHSQGAINSTTPTNKAEKMKETDLYISKTAYVK